VSTYVIEASAPIAAPAPRVYALIADYRTGHPQIVPPRAFSNLRVIEGGVGAGTRIRFDLKVMGRAIDCTAAIAEPEPGRVLVETDAATGARTTFTVEPSGGTCRVTISTEMPDQGGPLAPLARWLTRRALSGLYVEELERLAALAARPIS
jgi:hypothetical protein